MSATYDKDYKLCKTLSKESVRQMCIEHNYYTCGDNEQYGHMFSLLDHQSKVTGSNISVYRLEEIAEDIKLHSKTEDTVEDIMFNLCARIRVTLWSKPL